MAARVILAIALAVGLIAFILYGADKRRARKGRWRIPESVLLGFGFFGGSIGALLGMYLFRHKTKHWQFKVLVPVFFILHLALAVWLVKSGLLP